ncbi:hypothetical protein Hanom_Chr10g00872421 [Helianthus anomalus]
MCGHTRADKIRNEVIWERFGVASISYKIREGRSIWFGHVRIRQATATVRSVETLTVEGRRSRGRPKLIWDDRIRNDLVELHLRTWSRIGVPGDEGLRLRNFRWMAWCCFGLLHSRLAF